MNLTQRLIRPYIFRELPGWGRLYGRFVGDYRRDVHWAGAGRRTIRGKLHGYEMDLDLSHWSERTTYFLGRFYDLEMQLLLIGLLRPGDRFVDVGANIGMISLVGARLVGESGVVDAFEPNPACASRIESFVARNRISQVRIHRMGAGEADAELTLTIPRRNAGEASLTRFDGEAMDPEAFERVSVAVRPADAVLDEDPRPPVFIKIDVEGYECFALKGLAGTLARHRPLVATEVAADYLKQAGSTPADLARILEGLGYHGWSITSRRVGLRRELALEPIDPASTFYNALWIPDEGPARERFLASFPNLARLVSAPGVAVAP
ncbi:FkbM family methyltransferase [Paludisphaera soli]|uniref:FkbM family methyltransferase n=1 Tax=Paludisphaera soli TaxID=2712865 RepID=UPI0013EAE317|nr:FkbM family methyltransferase [Paludisphaera soli]